MAVTAGAAVMLAGIVVIDRDHFGGVGMSTLPGATGQPAPTGPTDNGPNDDGTVRAVVNEYVDAINADDLSRLLNISVGAAQLELETIDIQRNANDVGRWTESHAKKLRAFKNSYGDVKIVSFEIIARGDKRVVAHVHTRFARQPDVMYLPGEDARFDLIEKPEGWRIESVGTYVAP